MSLSYVRNKVVPEIRNQSRVLPVLFSNIDFGKSQYLSKVVGCHAESYQNGNVTPRTPGFVSRSSWAGWHRRCTTGAGLRPKTSPRTCPSLAPPCRQVRAAAFVRRGASGRWWKGWERAACQPATACQARRSGSWWVGQVLTRLNDAGSWSSRRRGASRRTRTTEGETSPRIPSAGVEQRALWQVGSFPAVCHLQECDGAVRQECDAHRVGPLQDMSRARWG